MYPKSFIDELKNRITLSAVIGKKVPLKKKGKDLWGCCPFHAEKTASFSVSDIKGFYKCFGCGKSGNIFDFVMEIDGLNFKEAIERLAHDFGIPLPKIEKKQTKEINEIDLLLKINEETCIFFENNIFRNNDAMDYALKRGLTRELIKKFRIGYAPNDFHALIDYMKNKNISEKELLGAGVIAENNGNIYDKFRDRIIFPVLNRGGKVIAFQGRTLGDGVPKYLNSPETKVFVKGNTLFNYYFARKSIYEKDFAVLVEGNMDALSLSINGIENVVAPMGTGITENQVRELWRATDKVFVCLDGDKAGRNAMVRLSKLVLPLIEVGKNMNFVFLPNATDPDDFIRKQGYAAFVNLLNKSVSLSNYIWNNEIEGLNTEIPENRAILEKNITNLLLKIQDVRLRSEFERFYKNKLWEIKKNYKVNELEIKTQDIKNEVNIDLIEKIEKQICGRIYKYPDLINELNKNNLDIFNIKFYSEKCIEFIDKLMADENTESFETYFESFDKRDDEVGYINVLLKIRYKELLSLEIMALNDNNKIKEYDKEIKKIKQEIENGIISFL
jgi:DNA primase